MLRSWLLTCAICAAPLAAQAGDLTPAEWREKIEAACSTPVSSNEAVWRRGLKQCGDLSRAFEAAHGRRFDTYDIFTVAKMQPYCTAALAPQLRYEDTKTAETCTRAVMGWLLDNKFVEPIDYSEYGVMGPSDPRLPELRRREATGAPFVACAVGMILASPDPSATVGEALKDFGLKCAPDLSGSR